LSLRRAERAVAGAIALQLLVAVPAVLTLEPAPGKRAATTRADVVRGAEERTEAIKALLARRAHAVVTRDKDAFLADLDPSQDSFRRQQEAVFGRLSQLTFSGWRYELNASDEQDHTAALDKARGTWWAPDVELRYEIAGYDSTPTEEDQGFTFVHRDGRWYLAADADFPQRPTQRDIWDLGDLSVTTGRSCLVLAHPSGAGMAALALRECDAAVPRVTAVWGSGWSRRVVLLMPDTVAELRRLVPDVGDVSNVAAVATAELVDATTGYHPVGDRVIVNPGAFRELGPVGRRVVLTHEVTHVATRSATGPYVPTWLVEGIADYVGFLHTDIPLSLSALELRKAMRAGRIPSQLPTDRAFTGGRSDLAATYEQSWLAVTLLVKTYGLGATLRLYRDIGKGTGDIDGAFEDDLHTSVAAFTKSWSSALKRALL
jgi:hypothetical protein